MDQTVLSVQCETGGRSAAGSDTVAEVAKIAAAAANVTPLSETCFRHRLKIRIRKGGNKALLLFFFARMYLVWLKRLTGFFHEGVFPRLFYVAR